VYACAVYTVPRMPRMGVNRLHLRGPRLAMTLAGAAVGLGLISATASASPLFQPFPLPMTEERVAPVTALLPDGNVLLAGGPTFGHYPLSSEVFNPTTNRFEKISAEVKAVRGSPATAVLAGGKVLVAGGANSGGEPVNTAEVFNPEAGKFETLAKTMTVTREGAGAAPLPNGDILIAGGVTDTAHVIADAASAEVFNPVAGKFEKLAGEMSQARVYPIAAPLSNGKVLIAGGEDEVHSARVILKSAELFNPATDNFEGVLGTPTVARTGAGAAALPDGEVLIVGGANEAGGSAASLASAELFNPATDTFEALTAVLGTSRELPGIATLPDGRVLIAGGVEPALGNLQSAELFVSPPLATTAAASSLTPSSATLGGTVTAEAASSTYFQYGTTTAYGASTAHQTTAPSIAPSAVSAPVTGLSPTTIYHFRVVTENAGGMAFGADQTFTTPAATVLPGTRPVITGVTESHSRWRDGTKLAGISTQKRKPPVGTTFGFSLNERAAVTFSFTHRVRGHRVGAKCAIKSAHGAPKRSCQRTATAGTLSFTGQAGRDTVAFQGILPGSRKLKPGRYMLVMSAATAAGRSAAASLAFTVVR